MLRKYETDLVRNNDSSNNINKTIYISTIVVP